MPGVGLTILALDSACAACSVAVRRGGRLLSHDYRDLTRGHAAVLVPMVEAALTEAGLWFRDLDRLAVTVGPGGFTGVRIGLATARGFALAAELPLVAVTTLEAVATGALAAARNAHRPLPPGAALLVGLDAKRADIYGQLYRIGQTADADPRPVTDPLALPPGALIASVRPLLMDEPLFLAGDMADALQAVVQDAGLIPQPIVGAPSQPDAATVAAIAVGREGQPGHSVGPLYLRPPDAKLPAAASPGSSAGVRQGSS